MSPLPVLITTMLLALPAMSGCGGDSPQPPDDPDVAYKPVVYLYPEEETAVDVTLDYDGELTCTYPAYEDGWHVVAAPDGTLIDPETGRTYAYLFWEGRRDTASAYDMSRGFVVPGADTAAFLQETLPQLGLTPREYNEFIVFWLPQMQGNPYNLITFQTDAYTDHARLHVTPEPDTVLRVFMVWQPLQEPIAIEAPVLPAVERTGFTVVEWGGTCIG